MWPDRPWAEPAASFPSPVEPPTVDPDASPALAVTISCLWMPYIRGALQQLLLQTTWKGDSAAILLAQQRVFNLIDLFQECSSSVLPFACPYDYLVNSGGWSTVDGRGLYVLLNGWRDTFSCPSGDGDRTVFIHKTFSPAVTINHLEMLYDFYKGTFNWGSWSNGFVGLYGGSLVITQLVDAASDSDGSNKTISWSGSPQLVDEIKMALSVGRVRGCSDPGGEGLVKYFLIDGVGSASC